MRYSAFRKESVNGIGAVCGFFCTFAVEMRKIIAFVLNMVTMSAMAQEVIDLHSHIITPEFVSALEKEGRLLDEGFPLPKWDAEAQLKWVDEAGIQTSVLTLAASQPQETHPQPLPVMEGSGYLQDKDLTEGLSTPLPHREGQGGGSLVRLAEIEVYPQYSKRTLKPSDETRPVYQRGKRLCT